MFQILILTCRISNTATETSLIHFIAFAFQLNHFTQTRDRVIRYFLNSNEWCTILPNPFSFTRFHFGALIKIVEEWPRIAISIACEIIKRRMSGIHADNVTGFFT